LPDTGHSRGLAEAFCAKFRADRARIRGVGPAPRVPAHRTRARPRRDPCIILRMRALTRSTTTETAMIPRTNATGVSRWTTLVRAEYREMPGMSLTRPQMQRLWGFDAVVCDAIVRRLTNAHVLRERRDGRLVASDETSR
jgi:hypothetical protein